MDHKKILAISGLIVVLLVAGAYFVITQNEFYRFSDEELETSLRETAIAHNVSSLTAARDNTALGSMSIEIGLSYQEKMKETETLEVRIEYDRTITIVDTNGKSDRTRQPSTKSFSIKLSSSAFEIAPQDKIIKKEGTDFPTQFLWTITPQQPGEHLLRIDLTEVLSTEYVGDPAYFQLFTVNGDSMDITKWRTLTLPVKVYTYLCISKATIYLGGFIGYVLMHPFFIDWIRKWACSR